MADDGGEPTPRARPDTGLVQSIRRYLSPDEIPARTARVYIEAILPDFRILKRPETIPDAGDWREVMDIFKQYDRDADSLNLSQSLLFERLVLRLQPDAPLEGLRRKVLTLRERYRALVGPEEFQAYAAATPEPPAAADAAALKADAEDLVSRFHRVYALAPFREEARNIFSAAIVWRLIHWLIAAAVLYGFLYLINHYRGEPTVIPTVVVVAACGALGGFISVQQRMESAPSSGDPIRGVLSLTHGWFSVNLSPVMGAVFAVLLYLLFIGKFLEGALFPELPAGSKEGGVEIYDFMMTAKPESRAAFAKLLVWSVIAGFGERVVPDTLTRMAESVRTGQAPAPPGKP